MNSSTGIQGSICKAISLSSLTLKAGGNATKVHPTA